MMIPAVQLRRAIVSLFKQRNVRLNNTTHANLKRERIEKTEKRKRK
jgi:hypothetical protein